MKNYIYVFSITYLLLYFKPQFYYIILLCFIVYNLNNKIVYLKSLWYIQKRQTVKKKLFFATHQSQTDAIIGWVDKAGRPFLMDTWINGYTAPLLDASQDLSNITGNTADGLTTLSFMRKRSTGDTKVIIITIINIITLIAGIM